MLPNEFFKVPHWPYLFLINVNNLADNLSNVRLFADASLLFSVVHNVNTSASEVNNDSVKNDKFAYQWKMSCNADPIKQVHETIFTRKLGKEDHPPLVFEQ